MDLSHGRGFVLSDHPTLKKKPLTHTVAHTAALWVILILFVKLSIMNLTMLKGLGENKLSI